MIDGSKAVTRKALFGMVKRLVIFPILLFLPAGTLRFWQAWIFWFVIVISVLPAMFYFLKRDPALIERRLRRGPTAEKEKSQKIILVFVMAFFFAQFVIPGLDHRFGWSHVPPGIVIAGDLFVAVGFYIIFLTFRENSFASATIEINQGQKVVTTGPYRIVRHPMYAGSLLMQTFIPLALGSYWALLIVPLMFLAIIWRLVEEEEFLVKNLPGYGEYREKTPYRLVPFMW